MAGGAPRPGAREGTAGGGGTGDGVAAVDTASVVELRPDGRCVRVARAPGSVVAAAGAAIVASLRSHVGLAEALYALEQVRVAGGGAALGQGGAGQPEDGGETECRCESGCRGESGCRCESGCRAGSGCRGGSASPGCWASVVDWAVGRGCDRRLAREALRLGRVLALVPGAREKALCGALGLEAAAQVGRLLERARHGVPLSPEQREALAKEAGEGPVDPALLAPSREPAEVARRVAAWTREVAAMPMRRVLDRVNGAIEEIAQRQSTRPLTFHVGRSGRDLWRRAHRVACRREGRVLTQGEAFTLVVRDWVRRHDDLSAAPRGRRVGPTSERPGERHVPASVRREVRTRALDHCEFTGCGNGIWGQTAHVVPHAAGGDREAGNLVLLCGTHHSLLDAGRLRFAGRGPDGVTFVDPTSGEVFAPRPSAHAADALPPTAGGGRGPPPRGGAGGTGGDGRPDRVGDRVAGPWGPWPARRCAGALARPPP